MLSYCISFLRGALLLLIAVYLTGCAVEYRKAGGGVSGYEDHPIGEGRYLVVYTESERVPWQQIHGFALKRCAEITQREGFTAFDVLSKKEQNVYLQSDVKNISVPVQTNAIGSQVSSESFSTGAWLPGRRVIYEIKLLSE